MTNLIKPSEAMSHGRIFKIKREEQRTIQQQIDEFFGKGGKIQQIESGVSGENKQALQNKRA